MATVIGLAMKITADATGLPAALTPVEKAFAQLSAQADKATKIFDNFAGSSSAAAQAQTEARAAFAAIAEQLRTGVLTAEEYAAAFAALTESTRATVSLFEEGARVTAQYKTAESERIETLFNLNQLQEAGAISAATYAAAVAEVSGANAAAQAAEDARIKNLSEGATITAQFATEEEKRAAKLADLNRVQESGVLSAETYARALAEVSGASAAAAAAATEEAKRAAATTEEGLRATEQVRTAEERRATELEKLESLLSQGAISQETFVRASERATGVEKERADATASAARVIAANLSPQERYSQQMQELSGHLEAGRLSQDQFNRAAQKAKVDLDGIGKEAGKADKNIEQLNKNVNFLKNVEIGRLVFDGVRLLGSAFASVQNQISGLVTSVNSSIDQLNDFSQRTGIGVEALQGYSLAAKLAGVDTEQFGGAIQKLAVNIGKATPGDALDKSLRAINLSVGELRALAPEQQFSAIGNAISTLPTVADRAAAAVEIFGKQGAALAPLFREGADSIEELQARAEKLGLIVDEAQVNNVASMNDAFDLVAATVQGITGQVIGNLAPAVTDVTNQFLKFVEEFAGTAGTGGTGIANAITDTLLKGAEYFAGVFDEYVQYFGGFTGALTTASETFNQITGVLDVLVGVFKSIFNTFEIIGNGIAVALGKALEAIGSYVSTDLENFGRDLQTNANTQLQQNLAELESAGQQIIDGTTQAVFGNAAEQQAAAAGAATTYLDGLRAQIERERSPQFKIETDIEETRERFDSFFNGIVDQGSAVTEAMRGFEAATASVADSLNITEEEIQRIKVEQDKVNRAVDQELQARQAAKDVLLASAEADAKRIEILSGGGKAVSQAEQDVLVVQRERLRVAEELAAAQASGDTAAVGTAQASLNQLDALKTKAETQLAASGQGFADGYTKAFDTIDANIQKLSESAVGFGKSGAEATEQLRAGIANAQAQAKAGFLNSDQLAAEVAAEEARFNKEIENIKSARDFANGLLDASLTENEKNQAAAQERAHALEQEFAQRRVIIEEQILASQQVGDLTTANAAQQRLLQLDGIAQKERDIASGKNQVDQLLFNNLNGQEQARLNFVKQEEAARIQAAKNVVLVEQQIAIVEQEIKKAREEKNLLEAKAGVARLAQLDQVLEKEKNVADGKVQQQQQQAKSQNQYMQQQEAAAQQQQQQQQAAAQAAAAAASAEFSRQEERLAKLSSVSTESLQVGDVRSKEGVALVLDLAANAQDPALIEARIQTKLLNAIALGLAGAASNYFNQPVAIVGAARLN